MTQWPDPPKNRNKDWWKVQAIVPGHACPAFINAFETHCLSASAFEQDEKADLWLVEGMIDEKPDLTLFDLPVQIAAEAARISVPQLALVPFPQLDWLQHVHDQLRPIRSGRFYIHGSHHKDHLPQTGYCLQIEAATAFGTGQHETTKGCLEALEWLHRRNLPRNSKARILDMGCGSGILSLAAAKLWRQPVCAVDIDVEAVRVTADNARINRIAPLLRAQAGDGYHVALVRQQKPFDIIVANILAKPLIRMAPQMRKALRPGGYVVLSGLLDRQERAVLHAHQQQGLKLVRRIKINAWRALILR